MNFIQNGLLKKTSILAITAILTSSSLRVSVAHASIGDIAKNVIVEANGIVTDPFKLGKASENILEAVERINKTVKEVQSLEHTTNQDVQDRLVQVQQIVDDVVSGARTDIAAAEQAVEDIEDKLYADVMAVLQKAECVAQDIATIQLQEAIASVINTTTDAHIGVTVLGVEIIKVHSNRVEVIDPDKAYVTSRDASLAYMRSLGPNANAYEILSALANISRIALLTRCSYQGNALDSVLFREQQEYDLLARQWSDTVPVDVRLSHGH
jgi:hypothetical protein